MPISNGRQLAPRSNMWSSQAMNAFVASHLVNIAALAAGADVAAAVLNNNANNNTRNHGWAGV